MDDYNWPFLKSCKDLKPQFDNLNVIKITSDNFTIGRSLDNSVVIPFISISRSHCKFKLNERGWLIEDNSSYGIDINGTKMKKGATKLLSNDDVIKLEPSEEFVYKFVSNCKEMLEVPRKRIKLEKDDIIDDVKLKFEESQSYEIKHIEAKIENVKQMQTTSIILKQQLQLDMDRKIKDLENDFAVQIENLKGEKYEVERQKSLLIEERDNQLKAVRHEMNGKIAELMEQIHKHNQTESNLLNENKTLKEKLLKEREEFMLELNRESSSKHEMLEKLKAKMKEQEEELLKEKEELKELLQTGAEQLRLAKEKELELEEQNKKREEELVNELNNIKENLAKQIIHTEQQRALAQEEMNSQLEQMKKLNDQEKAKMDVLVKEREEIQKKLDEAQANAEKSLEALKARVNERETELAALAADRIQKQAEQSSEVITSLQEQLEKVKNHLQSVESEKDSLLKKQVNLIGGEGTSKETALAEVGELMESELQCSICAELFVSSTTLSCSHTFCKYCITMWKRKKKDCPICRAPITSECKSLVLDSFIEKMAQNLTEEMKAKRAVLLKSREEEVAALSAPAPMAANRTTSTRGRRRHSRRSYSRTNITSAPDTTMTSTIHQSIPTVDLTMLSVNNTNLMQVPSRNLVVVNLVRRTRLREQPAPTTAATEGASAAADAATGPPAVPSDSTWAPPPPPAH